MYQRMTLNSSLAFLGLFAKPDFDLPVENHNCNILQYKYLGIVKKLLKVL